MRYDVIHMRLLLVEDNEKLATYVKQALTEEGYAVDHVKDGESAERTITGGDYDLVLLDIMLPHKDGISIAKSVRSLGYTMPIILITAKGEVKDRVEGLDSGADDYLIKPFSLDELLARVRALLRRPVNLVPEILRVQDIELNTNTREVKHSKRVVKLTPKEYAILEYLLRNAGKVVSRDELLKHCWDFAYDPFSNITDAYIKQLRRKLKDKNEKYIKTVRGVGYTFKEG